MEIEPAADEFLRVRVWGQLATSRSSGAPQVTMVAYHWDGADLVVSCRRQTAKFANVSRRRAVVFTVADGIDIATVVGEAECFSTGLLRDTLTQRLRDHLAVDNMWAAEILDRDAATGLDEADRGIIRLTPASVTLTKPLG